MGAAVSKGQGLPASVTLILNQQVCFHEPRAPQSTGTRLQAAVAPLRRSGGLSVRATLAKAARSIRWSLWHPFSITVSCDQGQEKLQERGRHSAHAHTPQSLSSVGFSLEKAQLLTQPVSCVLHRYGAGGKTSYQGRVPPFARRSDSLALFS